MLHPSRDFLTVQAVNLLIGEVAKNYAGGGNWAIESVVRRNDAEATVTYVVGTHPGAFEPDAYDDRPRVRVNVYVHDGPVS